MVELVGYSYLEKVHLMCDQFPVKILYLTGVWLLYSLYIFWSLTNSFTSFVFSFRSFPWSTSNLWLSSSWACLEPSNVFWYSFRSMSILISFGATSSYYLILSKILWFNSWAAVGLKWGLNCNILFKTSRSPLEVSENLAPTDDSLCFTFRIVSIYSTWLSSVKKLVSNSSTADVFKMFVNSASYYCELLGEAPSLMFLYLNCALKLNI